MRSTLLGVLILGLLVVPSRSQAAPKPTPQPQDSVTAAAALYPTRTDGFFPVASTTLDVRSGPAGENPTGTFFAHVGGGAGPSYSGTVRCLSVAGGRAVMGVEGTVSQFGVDSPFAAIVEVVDGGPTTSQPPWPDTFAFTELRPPGPTNCSIPPPPGPPTYMFFAGDITVVDAPSLPTSKDQCKHGGWAQFGFRNQGQCIRFVKLIPGPPPYPSTNEQCRHGGWAQYGFKNKRKCLRFVRLRPNP